MGISCGTFQQPTFESLYEACPVDLQALAGPGKLPGRLKGHPSTVYKEPKQHVLSNNCFHFRTFDIIPPKFNVESYDESLQIVTRAILALLDALLRLSPRYINRGIGKQPGATL